MFGCWIVWPISQTVTPRFASHLGAEMSFERFLEQKTSCQNRWCPNLCIYNEAIHGNNFRLACLVAQVQFLAVVSCGTKRHPGGRPTFLPYIHKSAVFVCLFQVDTAPSSQSMPNAICLGCKHTSFDLFPHVQSACSFLQKGCKSG